MTGMTVMTEAEWWACDDSEKMLNSLTTKASDRKLRLFACACCRHAWHLLSNAASREAVEVAERFADGLATEIERKCEYDLRNMLDADVIQEENADTRFKRHFAELAAHFALSFSAIGAARQAAGLINTALENMDLDTDDDEPKFQAKLLRDILGNPFRDVTIDPACMGGEIRTLAQAIYDQRAFDRMPELLNTLIGSGRTDQDILVHCTPGGEHARGCWVIDLLIGKE
jgi:hypothetical protein